MIEIIEVIWNHIGPSLAAPGSELAATYQQFVESNPEFLRLTAPRVDSYWACYYRHRCPNPADYPGRRLVDAMQGLARS